MILPFWGAVKFLDTNCKQSTILIVTWWMTDHEFWAAEPTLGSWPGLWKQEHVQRWWCWIWELWVWLWVCLDLNLNSVTELLRPDFKDSWSVWGRRHLFYGMCTISIQWDGVSEFHGPLRCLRSFYFWNICQIFLARGVMAALFMSHVGLGSVTKMSTWAHLSSTSVTLSAKENIFTQIINLKCVITGFSEQFRAVASMAHLSRLSFECEPPHLSINKFIILN